MLTRRRSGGSPAACRLSALLKEAAVAGSRVHAVQESVSAHCDPLLLQNLVNAFFSSFFNLRSRAYRKAQHSSLRFCSRKCLRLVAYRRAFGVSFSFSFTFVQG